MVEFGVITGEVDGTWIRVQYRTGEKFWAPMITFVSNVSIPSEKWIKANKHKYVALVSFEKDILENPMVVGFYPVKGATAEADMFSKLLALTADLISILQQATIMTQLGPQKIMSQYQTKLSEAKSKLNEIVSNVQDYSV